MVADEGFDGTVLQVATRGVAVAALAEHALQVEAGVDWDDVVALGASTRGYAGLEALSGIPGRVGATPIQNVGAYGQEVAQTVALGPRPGPGDRRVVARWPPTTAASATGQRVQARSDRYVVLAVTFAARALRGWAHRSATPSWPAASASRSATRVPAADVRAAVLELRRGKGMVLDPSDHDTWSAGSFFTNPLLAADEAAAAAGGRAALARPTTAGSRPRPPG